MTSTVPRPAVTALPSNMAVGFDVRRGGRRLLTLRGVTAAALSVLLVAGLSGCSLLEPAGTNKPPSGMSACALGHTWTLDVGKLADAVKADLVKQNVAVASVAIDGTQTLEWDSESKVVLTTDYTTTITATPAADQTITVKNTHKGTSTGVAYINAEVAIPRNWDATGLSVKSTADLNGAALDPIPFTVPETDLDDSVGLEMTCDGDGMTTHPRGTEITQTWTRKG